jgi:hypothetical protein
MTSSALALTTVDDAFRVASELVKSGFLPKTVDTPGKAFAIITLGQELGFAAWQSINSIDVIQGKPTLKPQAMLALIHKSGLAESIEIPTTEEIAKAKSATVTMKRKGGGTHTATFSWAMAQSMQTTEWINNQKKTVPLTEKYNWKSMPEIMMMWRAVSSCARILFADVIMGMYSTDEIDADGVASSDMRIEMTTAPLTVVPKEQPQIAATVPDAEIEAPEEAPKLVEEAAPAPAFDKNKWDAVSAKAWYDARISHADFNEPTKDDIFNALHIKVKLSEFKDGGWAAADAALKAYFGTPVDQRYAPVRDADVRLGTKGAKLATETPSPTAEDINKFIADNEIPDAVVDAIIEDNIQDLATPAPAPVARQWFEPKPEAPIAPAAPPEFKKDDMKNLLVEGRVHMQQIGKSANSVCYSFKVIGDLGTPDGVPDKRIEFAECMSRKVFDGTKIDTSKWPKDDPKVQSDEGLWLDLGWAKSKVTFVFKCEFNGKGGWIIKGVSE